MAEAKASALDTLLARIQKLPAEIVNEVNAAGGTQGAQTPEIVRSGKEIILPKGMSYANAIAWIVKKATDEETVVAIHEEVDALPGDGAVAFQRAVARTYGFSEQVAIPGGFFFPDHPPQLLGVEVALDKTIQVPWGRIKIPTIDGWLETGAINKGTRMKPAFAFVVTGEVKKRHQKDIHDLIALTREIVRHESIYKGKAIRIAFTDSDGDPIAMPEPKFMDLRSVDQAELVLPQETGDLVNYSLFTPIEHTEACRLARIPLKRGILLSGPYGCGKTLTAKVTALKAQDNGWTFLYLSSAADLAPAIHFARKYEPCVIFAEDIDAAMGDRDEKGNDILNTIDGVDTKSREIVVVLTTNHIERIHPAMLRAGRLDAVISIGPPDAEAAARLLRLYGRGLIASTADLTKAAKLLQGHPPAMVRECIERAKLAAVARIAAGSPTAELEGSDLLVAAQSMLHHLALITPKEPDRRSDSEKSADSLADAIRNAATAVAAAMTSTGDAKAAPGEAAATL